MLPLGDHELPKAILGVQRPREGAMRGVVDNAPEPRKKYTKAQKRAASEAIFGFLKSFEVASQSEIRTYCLPARDISSLIAEFRTTLNCANCRNIYTKLVQ